MSKAKHESLSFQIKHIISNQFELGLKRHETKINGPTQGRGQLFTEKIPSIQSVKNHLSQVDQFVKYLKSFGCKTVEQARQYADGFIQASDNYYTQNARVAMLGRLYNEPAGNFDRTASVSAPNKGRGEDKYIDWKLYPDLEMFQKASGLRHGEYFRPGNMKVDDFYEDGNKAFFRIRKGKGGKTRIIPILEICKSEVKNIVEQAKAEGKDLIFSKSEVPKNGNFHALRREYAWALYRQEIAAGRCGDGSRKQTYYCRGIYKGEAYDKVALNTVSKALGHGDDRGYTVIHYYFH